MSRIFCLQICVILHPLLSLGVFCACWIRPASCLGASARVDGAGGRRLQVSAEELLSRQLFALRRQPTAQLCDTEFFTSWNGIDSHYSRYSTHYYYYNM